MDFCAHDEGTDDVNPISDEDQGGCCTRESIRGMDSLSDVDLEGRVRFFRPFHHPQKCLFVSLQIVWRATSLQGSQDCAISSRRIHTFLPQHTPDNVFNLLREFKKKEGRQTVFSTPFDPSGNQAEEQYNDDSLRVNGRKVSQDAVC